MAKQKAESPTALDHGATPWLLTVALATAGPHAEHLPLWLSMLVGTLIIWRTWLWFMRKRLPSRMPLMLLVASSIAGIGWQFHTLFGRDAGVALLVLFMALKPLEMRSRRDALVLIMLGYFLLLTHYFYSQSIATGLWLLAATTLLTATLIRLHGGAQPTVAIIRYAGLLLAQALPFMLILYILFPRISGPLWGLPQDAHAGLTGLSDSMAPGSLSTLIQSGAIAFRVRFTGAPPKQSELYWRGPTLDDYDGLSWRSTPSKKMESPTKPSIEITGRSYDYVSTLEAHNHRWLLALDLPTGLPPDSQLASTLEALSSAPLRDRARYVFTSAVHYRVNVLESRPLLQRALQLPSGINPRTRMLAG
ncbi:MAG: DUF3488 domain-containing protein, partial [Burkholderiales bacterium]